jgi:hypothetical protein
MAAVLRFLPSACKHGCFLWWSDLLNSQLCEGRYAARDEINDA